ncbi:hypothetical protein A2U01_0119026, partial [Trifolium medium]|nr:hypothetical protein [Trifolium medium]
MLAATEAVVVCGSGGDAVAADDGVQWSDGFAAAAARFPH